MGLFGSATPSPTAGSSILSFGSGNSPLKSLVSGVKDQGFFKAVLSKFGFNGAVATIGSFVLYAGYLKFVKHDDKGLAKLIKDRFAVYIHKIPGLTKVPLLKNILPALPKDLIFPIPQSTKSALASISGTAPGLLSKLNPFKWGIFHKKSIAEQEDDEKYQAGESYGDPKVVATGIVKDLHTMGLKAKAKDLQLLVEIVKSTGKTIDDRQLAMEKIMAIAASLPRHSKARKKLTGVLIDTLWKSLQHPPLSYLGNKYQYRTPDGSYNNPHNPDLGKAGSHYARSVQKIKHTHGTPPDPGLLFDLLMARSDDTYKENPAGISTILFYHATLIIHDVFRTNHFDSTINDASSYLDLAPLYGCNLEEQLSVRTMSKGLLKPDAFAEKRLLGMPPGINVLLVMYNRFHNYVADVLLKINENGRFTVPPTRSKEAEAKALAKQDEDIFQTARLVTNGLYVNISLHDYIRGLTNVHHSASDWTLDPRVEVGRLFDPDGVPRGMGNQVSVEFNLLYRFHPAISRRDENWTNKFFSEVIFKDLNKPLDQLTPEDFKNGLFTFEKSIHPDPGQRVFDGLERDESGRFSDEKLVEIMTKSMEDPAGLFGPRMIPKALRIIEITGILTARKWNLASLNEMRAFFGLKRHETFEEINPDPEIADLLRKLYDHPDMVEMYPGLFMEDGKPRMDPGVGACPPYTVGRSIFSDAVSLVRSDRFLTLDYTAANLTCWGYNEVNYDLDVLGGSMFYKLFQRAFPGWFPYNSLHVTQPMFTRKMNETIAREIGTIDDYNLAGPSPPPNTVPVMKYSTVTKVVNDQANFHVIWTKYLNDMTPGKKYDSYMLCGDEAANTAQKKLVHDILYGPDEFLQLIHSSTESVVKELLEAETLSLGKNLNQIDIIRDVAIPANTRLVADLFSLDLKTPENPNGQYDSTTLYTHLSNVREFGFFNQDAAVALNLRHKARDSADSLIKTTLQATKRSPKSIVDAPKGAITKANGAFVSLASHIPVVGNFVKKHNKIGQTSTGSLRWYGQQVVNELMAAGKTMEEASDLGWMNAVGGVGTITGLFADVLSFYLQEGNTKHWADIQNLASDANSSAANKKLRQYVLEAQRLTSKQRNLRVCVSETTIDGQSFKPGDVVICSLAAACKDPEAVPEPEKFKLDRPQSAYIHFNTGPHTCLGREIALAFNVSLLKICAGLKNLRPAPGDMGTLKSVEVNNTTYYLNDSWSYLAPDPTTWKLHFDGHGKGVAHEPVPPVTAGRNLDAIYLLDPA
ncbi:hypothetical protein KEM56_001984 [Ascosphaera pollenicola]|nr:hypothetical protein KEM56_001984 [Ascosphaera pollenicola]